MEDNDNESAMDLAGIQPAAKRRRIATSPTAPENNVGMDFQERSISPPPLKRPPPSEVPTTTSTNTVDIMPSPIKLTTIRDLPNAYNLDSITLHDIVGDSSIIELWQFNYLFDIDFLMLALHDSVRYRIPVNVVHGFWRHDDAARLHLQESAEQFPNVKLITAGKLQAFGTHHSKLMIIFRNNDTAEVVIHTANMIARDWTNLTQAVWRSPSLPIERDPKSTTRLLTLGSGECFKNDLLAYLRYYEGRTSALVSKLEQHDFSSVRAALVASVPKELRLNGGNDAPLWGWPRLKKVLRSVPTSTNKRPVIVVQVSSIASLGRQDTWLKSFQAVLGGLSNLGSVPILRIIFPTADEIRRSLDGYQSGASIHTKIQTMAQRIQLDYLRPMLCYWAGDGDNVSSARNHVREVAEITNPKVQDSTDQSSSDPQRVGGRRRAAPHIKTYIRFTDQEMTRIDWALVTSANLSTQAWGDLSKNGSVKISSYEIGVMIWPHILANQVMDNTNESKQSVQDLDTSMVPTFMTDTPQVAENAQQARTVIGFRMPYDIPLVRYNTDEVPWCATSDHLEPDWKGHVWKHD